MILQPLPNFKTQFSPKDQVGSYDNIELNQRFVTFTYTWLYGVTAAFIISHVGKKKKQFMPLNFPEWLPLILTYIIKADWQDRRGGMWYEKREGDEG